MTLRFSRLGEANGVMQSSEIPIEIADEIRVFVANRPTSALAGTGLLQPLPGSAFGLVSDPAAGLGGLMQHTMNLNGVDPTTNINNTHLYGHPNMHHQMTTSALSMFHNDVLRVSLVPFFCVSADSRRMFFPL